MKKICILFTLLFIFTNVFAQGTNQCPGFLPSRLIIGNQGRVTPGDPNNVRSEPNSNSERVGQIPGDGVFTILDGPVCADGFAWWNVDYNRLVGWTVEGSGETYWVEPIESIQPIILPENAISRDNLAQLTSRELDFTDLRDFAWSPDSRWAAFYENDGIWVKDYSTPEIGARLLIRSNQITRSSYQENQIGFTATNLLAYVDGTSVRFVSPDTGEAQFSLEVGNIQQFVMSADGTLLIALMFGEIQFWSIEPQTQTLIWNAEDDNYFWSVALSADNSLVAAATNSGKVIILETQSGAVIKTLRVNEYGNPDESIGELAFSPNGVQLAGASNRQVVLWDIAQGTKIASLVGRNQVIYSPDARLLLTVHPYEVTRGESEQRNDILIYDAETGAQLATLHVSADYSSRNLVFRPDGTAFYSVRVDSPSSGDNAPLEWTLGNGDNEIVDLIPPPDGSTCPGFLPLRLIVGESARVIPNLDVVNLRAQASASSVKLVEIPGGQTFSVIDGPQCFLGAAWWRVNYDGVEGWAAEGIADQYFLQPIVHPPETPQYAGDIQDLIGTSDITRTFISQDGSLLGVVDASGIWLYDLDNLDTPPELLYMPNQQVNDVTFNTDATLLAVGTGGFMPSETDIKAVWIWDVATHTLQTRLDQEFRVDAVAFSPDGQFLAVSQSSKLFLWHLPNSYEYGVLSLDGATDLIFNPDSRHLIVNYRDFYGEIWDITRGTVSESMYDSIGGGGDSPGDSMFYTPTLNPDGLTLATETLDGIILWNGVTGIRQQEIYKITDTSTRAPIRISDMAFSPDNHWLATSGDQLRLWDMTFNSVTVLQAELATEEQTLSVAFSGNGQYLLASGNERTELWEVNTRKRVATLTGRHGVFGDGDLAITFNSDIVYVWDMDGQLINELHTLTG